MRRKIAENLRLAVGYDRPGPVADPETLRKAWAELSAVLAVVRATRRVLSRGGYRMPYPEWSALVDADARLDRSSRPQRAGRGRR